MSVQVELTPRAKSAVTLAVMLAAIMQMLDTTIANVALPHMQGSPIRHSGSAGLGADLLHSGVGDYDSACRMAVRALRAEKRFCDFHRRVYPHLTALRRSQLSQ